MCYDTSSLQLVGSAGQTDLRIYSGPAGRAAGQDPSAAEQEGLR